MSDRAAGGNATFRFTDTAVLSVSIAEAPIVVTSAEIDEALADTYARLDVRPGLLEGLAGIVERRWWPEDVTFADAAAMAGAKALADAGIEAKRVGLLIDTSVSRGHLEPSAAVDVHHQLDMPSHCLNFDLSNACLGFVNGMHLAGTLIDAGQIDYAIIVDGEGSRGLHERTIERLQRPETTVADIFENFASLTLGSGGAAMVLGRASEHPEGHRFIGGVSRAATQHHRICVGDMAGRVRELRLDRPRLLRHPPGVERPHAGRDRGPGHRSCARADDFPALRQHRSRLHPLHARAAGRQPARGRSHWLPRHRLGPECQRHRDRLVVRATR